MRSVPSPETTHRDRHYIASARLEELWDRPAGCVSIQVLNEYFVNATQKLKPGLHRDVAWEHVEALKAWEPVEMDFPLIARGFAIQQRYQISYWDALIVAAAEVGGCSEILSEDLAHGAIYAGIQVRNPFAEEA